MSLGPTKIFIKVESSSEQQVNIWSTNYVRLCVINNVSNLQENLRNSRKSLKVLQKTSTDKENLVGRGTHAFIKSKS